MSANDLKLIAARATSRVRAWACGLPVSATSAASSSSKRRSTMSAARRSMLHPLADRAAAVRAVQRRPGSPHRLVDQRRVGLVHLGDHRTVHRIDVVEARRTFDKSAADIVEN